jgi:hypothetical protein
MKFSPISGIAPGEASLYFPGEAWRWGYKKFLKTHQQVEA